MEPEKLIGFDVDGVLADFTRGFTRIAHSVLGTPVGDSSTQESWNFEDFPALGLSKADTQYPDGPVWSRILESGRFWIELDPLNVSVMRRINAIKNKVFITNRVGVEPVRQTAQFLRLWGVDVSDARIVLAHEKGPVARALNVVAFVDDYIKNCHSVREHVPEAFVALVSTAHNRIHQDGWRQSGGFVALSVDHFLDECEKRGLVDYASSDRNDYWYARVIDKSLGVC